MSRKEKNLKSEEKNRTSKKRGLLLDGESPIVVTGGSVRLEYPDDSNTGDVFEPDTPELKKKKLKHKNNPKLWKVEVTNNHNPGDPPIIYQTIDLDNLGKERDCKVKIYYRS